MRRSFNLLCSLLVLATYLWGGCVSCEQFFMVPGATDDCCKHGKCKQTSHQSDRERSRSSQSDRACNTMPFAHQQDIESALASVAADLTVSTVPAAELYALQGSPWLPQLDFDPLADSPPDLVVLTGSFLI